MSWGTVAASTVACILAVFLIFSCLQYQVLSSDYINLYGSYQYLKSKYDKLQANYTDLYSRYQSLKDRYEGLQGDYQKALSRLKAVSEENSRLRENYSRLADSYEKLRLQYEDLKEKYGDLASRCSEVEVSLPRIRERLEEISDRIFTPSDRIPDMLKQASPTMVKGVVYGELRLRSETPPELKAESVLEWIMLNLEYLDDDFHQYLIDGRLGSHQDFLSLPNETLTRGGGDCEDLATLTYTMLKAVLGRGEEVYVVQICGGEACHVGTIYRLRDKIMILDPAGAYVTDARVLLEMPMKRGKVWLNPLAIRREEKDFLMEHGLANLIYMKSPGVEREAYRFLEAEDAVALWFDHWRREMISPSIRMVANDTFVKTFTSTQEFLDWVERS